MIKIEHLRKEYSSITPLKDVGLIEPVDVASLHSPRQAYKLTPKGRKALA